jgi:hypothetical protein
VRHRANYLRFALLNTQQATGEDQGAHYFSDIFHGLISRLMPMVRSISVSFTPLQKEIARNRADFLKVFLHSGAVPGAQPAAAKADRGSVEVT